MITSEELINLLTLKEKGKTILKGKTIKQLGIEFLEDKFWDNPFMQLIRQYPKIE